MVENVSTNITVWMNEETNDKFLLERYRCFIIWVLNSTLKYNPYILEKIDQIHGYYQKVLWNYDKETFPQITLDCLFQDLQRLVKRYEKEFSNPYLYC